MIFTCSLIAADGPLFFSLLNAVFSTLGIRFTDPVFLGGFKYDFKKKVLSSEAKWQFTCPAETKCRLGQCVS